MPKPTEQSFISSGGLGGLYLHKFSSRPRLTRAERGARVACVLYRRARKRDRFLGRAPALVGHHGADYGRRFGQRFPDLHTT